MPRIPEPDQTPDGPAFEGRLLDRADEEVVDQGVAFDLGTLVPRRRVLGCSASARGRSRSPRARPGGGPGGSTPTATTTPTDSATAGAGTGVDRHVPAGEIPDETAGPYPGDGSNGADMLERAASSAATSDRASAAARRLRACPSRSTSPCSTWRAVTRRSPTSPSTSGTVTRRAATRCTRTGSRTRPTCAESRSPTARVPSRSPRSFRPATQAGGRTSTSRCTPRRLITDSTNAIATSQVALPRRRATPSTRCPTTTDRRRTSPR